MPERTGEIGGLRILEDISALILQSHDLQETLDNIVAIVAKRMDTDVCSIYLLESDGETLTMQATRGLSRSSVGKIAMKTSEGLTGLVIEQRGVVSIENAPLHPRYKYFRGTKEEKYHSFLGLPLFERKTPIGVIVVQTKEPRAFSPSEISALSTIAYQISSIVLNAKLLDYVRKKEEERAYFERELGKLKDLGIVKEDRISKLKKGKQPLRLVGTPVSPGFSFGKVSVISRRGCSAGFAFEKVASKGEELKQFQLALEKAKIQTLYMEKRVAQTLSKEDAAIFHTHLMIMEDRGFIAKVTDLIETGFGAGRAVMEVVSHYINAFSAMEDPYLRERSADMEDIGRRILDAMAGTENCRVKLKEPRVIVAHDILPSDMAVLDPDKVLGIITEKGDVTSHAAIMAKSLGIPAVVGIGNLLSAVTSRDEVILDGNTGHIFVNADGKVKAEYERLKRDQGARQRELVELRELPAVTTDGVRIPLKANIGLISDIKMAIANGAEGVGLYRTEFPYMARENFPETDALYKLYRRILEGFNQLPVSIRTLDIGGDKELPYFELPKEDNPFLGWRSIRVCLEREDIFRSQLAAILMAAPYGNASLMFPMVSGIDEIRAIKRIIREVKEDLVAKGTRADGPLRIGIMVETPAAVQTADILIREVDYFSIGTNDLIQYTLAADRNNPKVKKYYDPYHPAVLHSIKQVAEAARKANKVVSVCGEMASEPINAILLAGMGVKELSVSAPSIPAVKQAIRSLSFQAATKLAEEVLLLESGEEIRQHLNKAQRELGLNS